MSAVFDTLRLVRAQRDKARFSTGQAEGMADATAEVMQGDFAARGDLVSIRTGLKADLRKTELRLEAKVAATKADLIQ